MVKRLEDVLGGMEYLGRFIAIGTDENANDVVVYGLTGRSPSSQARRLVLENDVVRTEPTDPETLAKGNPELLVYNCIDASDRRAVIVSNGRQTSKIKSAIGYTSGMDRSISLMAQVMSIPHDGEGIDVTIFEPDEPNYTPRITGMIGADGSIALGIVRNLSGQAIRSFHEVPRHPGIGVGRFIATYAGYNVKPGEQIPSFEGEPIPVQMPSGNAEDIANAVYEALGPKSEQIGVLSPGADFRVGVAVAVINPMQERTYHIINRHKE